MRLPGQGIRPGHQGRSLSKPPNAPPQLCSPPGRGWPPRPPAQPDPCRPPHQPPPEAAAHHPRRQTGRAPLRSAPPRRRGRPRRPPPARHHPRGRATPGWGRRVADNSPTSCVRACGTLPRRPSSPQQTARRAAAPPLAARPASAEAGHSCCSQMRRRARGGLGRQTAPPVSGIFRARPLSCRAWEVAAAMSPPAGSSCEGVLHCMDA